jgi:dephospho-CoA kinase
MIHVALTGNIAAGKSSVARLFATWGATVIDADAIVHELQQPGQPVLAAMVARFGAGILRPGGALNRPALRHRILEEPGARAALEAIVHPAVAARRAEQIAVAEASGASIIVSDIPLLFEAADPTDFDQVVLVDAPEAVRRDRLVRLRGIDPAEADRLIAAQMPSAAKRDRSHHVIDNAGSEAELEAAARAVWQQLAALAGPG